MFTYFFTTGVCEIICSKKYVEDLKSIIVHHQKVLRQIYIFFKEINIL